MKTIKLTILLLLSPLVFHAQTLTGLWVGSISNDSTTVRKDQEFEMVLTQYKNKVYGYSRASFIVNDTLYYIVKRVLGTIEGDRCEVKDDDIVAYNFKGRLDKGVKRSSSFYLDHSDSIWKMDGEWKTNKTKKYYAISGKMALSGEKDLAKSKIFPHLEELKLADNVEFYKESKKAQEQVLAASQPVKETKSMTASNTSVKETVNTQKQPESLAQVKEEPKKQQPPIQEKATSVASTETVKDDSRKQPQTTTTTTTETVKDESRKQPQTTTTTTETAKAESKPAEKQDPPRTEVVVEQKPVEQKRQTVNVAPQKQETVATALKEKDKQVSAPVITDAKPTIISAAAMVAQRKIIAPQVVNFKSDSLELALYDNGEVDGDTVSVLLNGEIIIAKQGLKVSAIKKTIYFPPGKDDSVTLVLYAENLGKYPPNTGLLVVHDGNDTYQVRFSADLQQNAAVIFKRKRN